MKINLHCHSDYSDGYEFQNSGQYLFSDETHKNKRDREIPAELKGKKVL